MSHWIINGRHTVKKLLKQIHWAIKRKQIEEGLMTYCKLEYSKGEATYAFNRALATHKANFLTGGEL